MFLARMITRSKWGPKRGWASNEIPADAITADLRTNNNALSFWQCGLATDPDVMDAVLAIAAGRERLQKVDIVWILQDELEGDGLRVASTPGRTPVPSLTARHVDVSHLDYVRLGRIGDRVATAISQDRCRRFRQPQVVTLLAEAVDQGRLSQEKLTDHIRPIVQATLDR